MSMFQRSMTYLALSAALGVVPAHAQTVKPFRWYIGGHGGLINFRTPTQSRGSMAAAGGHILVTAKRTGLLLSVEEGFGSDETSQTFFQVEDTTGVVASGPVAWTFQGIRKYSAVLVAYPVRFPNIQPFFGVGGGIMHATGTSAGPFADGSVQSELGSHGFATALAGLEFRIGGLAAFGQWQVNTKGGFRQQVVVLERDDTGKPITTRTDFGEWFQGATHTATVGLRFSLGSARE